jgi:hypothetical protein
MNLKFSNALQPAGLLEAPVEKAAGGEHDGDDGVIAVAVGLGLNSSSCRGRRSWSAPMMAAEQQLLGDVALVDRDQRQLGLERAGLVAQGVDRFVDADGVS